MMQRRLTMTLTLDHDEVVEALRKGIPEIPAEATVRIRWRPGDGPGSFKNKNKVKVQPFLEVVFDLPEPEEP
tara:strand:+ start:1487 stop:1702 length:216 start_codon:yes stop_codon:yes gene_type:complete